MPARGDAGCPESDATAPACVRWGRAKHIDKAGFFDEVGYLSYDARYADLLFEVITRRYQQRPTVLTTNKVFGGWNQVFPNAASVVTLVERLVHPSEILAIAGDSYRLKEAQERAAQRSSKRTVNKKTR